MKKYLLVVIICTFSSPLLRAQITHTTPSESASAATLGRGGVSSGTLAAPGTGFTETGSASRATRVTAAGTTTIITSGIFVSTTGNDADSGTYVHPFKTIQKGISSAHQGDTIYIRAGTYANNTSIKISASGLANKLTCLFAYPWDSSRPILDFSSMAYSGSNRGVSLSASYWHIKGLDIYRAGDNGMYTSGSNNIVEYCVFRENRDGGCQVGGGASNNKFLNCDAYFNYDESADTTKAGGNADGFSPKLDVGTGNYFYGCRAWQNSDDGFDGYLRPSDDVTTTIENCWVFLNGYLKDGVTTYPSMNGNGIKMGGSDLKNLRHNMVVKNCLSLLNKAKGFDQNNSLGSLTLLNCTAYNNGIGTVGGAYNFSIPLALAAGKVVTVENCLFYEFTKAPGYTFGTQVSSVFATDSWMSPFVSPTDADFLSLDTAGLRAPRKPDGSLPDITFMHLAPGSQFVNAGTDVGLPFNGSAPDLGCFETAGPTGVVSGTGSRPVEFRLLQNYPNPFNPSTVIRFHIPDRASTTLRIIDLLGRDVRTLFSGMAEGGREYSVVFNAASLPSGMYFSVLESGGTREIVKMMLMK